MNREQVNKYKKEIIAFCEGKIIEWRYKLVSAYNNTVRWSSWSINDNPDFIETENYEYRIKSEPKELWCIYTSEGNLYRTCPTKEAAELKFEELNLDYYIVHFIEDTEV